MPGRIWDDYADWSEVARQGSIEAVRAAITGAAEWAPNRVSPAFAACLSALVATSRTGEAPATVLDFGCGLGRNAPLLRRFFPRLVGFDIPEMIARLRTPALASAARAYDALYDDLDAVAGRETVPVVYDSVVFQHILDRPTVADILAKLRRIPGWQILITVKNVKLEETLLQRMLRERGWTEVFAERDDASFEGARHGVRHDLVVSRRPV